MQQIRKQSTTQLDNLDIEDLVLTLCAHHAVRLFGQRVDVRRILVALLVLVHEHVLL